jgi:hypothetical protein
MSRATADGYTGYCPGPGVPHRPEALAEELRVGPIQPAAGPEACAGHTEHLHLTLRQGTRSSNHFLQHYSTRGPVEAMQHILSSCSTEPSERSPIVRA